ncbi:hypothetical protein BFS14_02065 [Serratia fonticola]|uniref:hypothetical protein n=1 Tax=Serratia fonticola TaxID=47917 RepID=UPI0008FD3DB9|nr:hypothetical protein [Serratia fonticola]OIX96273.1 hypothetical protein BFS14_02065 [Serratia fonticola]QCR60805.1 hypothetical protein FD644_10705 [Serratia fonticola]
MTRSTVTNEQLRERIEIYAREQVDGKTPEKREIAAFYAAVFTELLAAREARPVAIIRHVIIGEGKTGCHATLFSPLPAGTELFTALPAPALPGELLDAMAEVIRISDRDHEAWIRAKAAISSCRAAILQPVSQGYTLPEGYKLVPIEPTPEMIAATEIDGDEYYFESDEAAETWMANKFKAMLAAAPTPTK